MRRLISLIAASMLFVLSGVGVMAGNVEPDPDCTYFEETGHNLCEPFESYWSTNGGLPVFGYPITEAQDELNPDLNQELLTQWFERERMEQHPENAGTPYEILLGRLGVEVLEDMDLNWFTFPKADPSAPHYFEETGHAIGEEFWDYWSSHGLDLGDEGTSFAESLALFGYPVSEVTMETNSSGDTVPTQWFERARFELHGDEVLLGLLGNELRGDQPPPDTVGEVIATGLNSPRGIYVGPDGAVYVAEAGIGGDECVVVPGGEGEEDFELCFGDSGQVTMIDAEGNVSVALDNLTSLDLGGGEAVGPQDVLLDDFGILVVTMGCGCSPADRDEIGEAAGDLGWIIGGDAGGATQRFIDVTAYEGENNPDGGDPAEGGIDSNPYSLVDLGFAGVASDAGANALLSIDDQGNLSTLAVFEARMVDAPPFLGLPEGAQIPMQAVPTGVTQGPDGAVYVGELTGFPFVPGAARVWRVTDEGQEVYADGFTNVIDVAFDGSGNLYVLEMVAGGLANASEEDPSSLAAQIVKVMPDGTRMDIASDGLIFATGMAIGPDGTIYVSNFGVMPGMGQVVAIEGVADPVPELPEPNGEIIAEGLNSPRGIDVGPDGTVYVAEAGNGGDECTMVPGENEGEEFELCFGDSGQVTMIDADGNQSVALDNLRSLDLGGGEAVGPQDVRFDSEFGSLIVVMGLGADPAERDAVGEIAGDLGWIVGGPVGGTAERFIDVAAYEGENNPDGGDPEDFGIDSNPYSVVDLGDSGVVSDAGANALLLGDAEGNLSTFAVFEPRMVDAPPFLGLPEGTQIPMQAVPTGAVEGPDGAIYVGELTGFPFVAGAARVWRVTEEGQEVYADGFTNVIDVAFDSEGNLYVLEMVAGGLLNAGDDISTLAAQIIKVAPDGTRTNVDSTGLYFATGMAIGPDDTIYISNFGVMPGMGQVVAISPE